MILVILVPVLLVAVAVAFAVVLVTRAIRDAIDEYYTRQRVYAEVARATARLRRIEHEATRQMHDVAESFIDVEAEEQ